MLIQNGPCDNAFANVFPDKASQELAQKMTGWRQQREILSKHPVTGGTTLALIWSQDKCCVYKTFQNTHGLRDVQTGTGSNLNLCVFAECSLY